MLSAAVKNIDLVFVRFNLKFRTCRRNEGARYQEESQEIVSWSYIFWLPSFRLLIYRQLIIILARNGDGMNLNSLLSGIV